MRLYLALAVLMLAFVAYTEAQGIEEKFASFTEKVNELGRDWAEKTKNAFDELHRSEFATNSRNWIRERFEEMKAGLQNLGQ